MKRNPSGASSDPIVSQDQSASGGYGVRPAPQKEKLSGKGKPIFPAKRLKEYRFLSRRIVPSYYTFSSTSASATLHFFYSVILLIVLLQLLFFILIHKETYRIFVYKSQLRDKISRRDPKPEIDTLKRSATGGTAVRYMLNLYAHELHISTHLMI